VDKYIGKLIGNTGNPNDLKIALENSFSAKRGEFVKIKHRESEEDGDTYVLGRIVSISRSNILYNSNMGRGCHPLKYYQVPKLLGRLYLGP